MVFLIYSGVRSGISLGGGMNNVLPIRDAGSRAVRVNCLLNAEVH